MSIFDRFRPHLFGAGTKEIPKQISERESLSEELETRLAEIGPDFEEKLVSAGAEVKKPKRVIRDTRYKQGEYPKTFNGTVLEHGVSSSGHEKFAKTLAYAGFDVTEPEMSSYFEIRKYNPSGEKVVVRIRKDELAKGTEMYLTVKGPKKSGEQIKERTEFEVKIAGSKEINALLTQAGFTPNSYIEKYRTTLHFSGCEIAVDEIEVQGFPRWAEIEGPTQEKIKETLKLIQEATGYRRNGEAIGQSEFIKREAVRLGLNIDPKNIRLREANKM